MDPPKSVEWGLLGCANDWKLLVDYDHRQYIFPPSICATNARPDVVMWSMRARAVLLLESPPAFRARNLFVSDNALSRA